MKNEIPQFHSRYSRTNPRPGVDCQAVKHAEAKTIADPEGRQNQGAKQSFKDSCDINKLVERAIRTGMPLPGIPQDGVFADLANAPASFIDAFNIVQQAEATFAALPAAIRSECLNRPEILLERLQDRSWAEKHGLLAPTIPQAEPSAPSGAVGGGQPPQSPTAPTEGGAKGSGKA